MKIQQRFVHAYQNELEGALTEDNKLVKALDLGSYLLNSGASIKDVRQNGNAMDIYAEKDNFKFRVSLKPKKFEEDKTTSIRAEIEYIESKNTTVDGSPIIELLKKY